MIYGVQSAFMELRAFFRIDPAILRPVFLVAVPLLTCLPNLGTAVSAGAFFSLESCINLRISQIHNACHFRHAIPFLFQSRNYVVEFVWEKSNNCLRIGVVVAAWDVPNTNNPLGVRLSDETAACRLYSRPYRHDLLRI